MVATPWDANMDAEQKLKGRVSVDQRMMATTAQSQQYTGDGLAASLPGSFFQDDSQGSYQIAKIVETYRCFVLVAGHWHAGPGGFRNETQHQQQSKATFLLSDSG